jgi:hypothetical protein
MVVVVVITATAAADDKILDYRRFARHRCDHQASTVPLGRLRGRVGGGRGGFEGVGHDGVEGFERGAGGGWRWWVVVGVVAAAAAREGWGRGCGGSV